MLKVENVKKTFGDIVALEDLTFDVGDGEFVFIMGPSGSGKTTLLRIILHDILPDTGVVKLDDIDVISLPSKEVPYLRQQIGTVFQDFKILPERTVRENVEVALAVIGADRNEWDERVVKSLELVDLGDRIDFFPAQLSGGERQKVSIARALVVNPKVILLDEPTGNLDWDAADELMGILDRINKEGKTILMATHHKVIVDKMKKKVVELGKARKKKKVQDEKKPDKDKKEQEETKADKKKKYKNKEKKEK